jgi:hypothetical protein
VGAVAQVEADQLIAAPADVEVLGAAEQLGLRRSERQRSGDGEELFAGLTVDVDAAGLRLHQGFAAGSRRAKPIYLSVTHGRQQ